MRLSRDTVLVLIDLQRAIDDPSWGTRNNPGAEANIARLLAGWRSAGLPIVHVRHCSEERGSPYRPEAPGQAFKPEAEPLPGEPVVPKSAHSAFVATDLELRLEAMGATSLVMCGVLTNNSVEASVRHGADLGFRVLVPGDACWAVDRQDRQGRLWPAEVVHRMALANLDREYAEVATTADVMTALALLEKRLAARRR